MKSSVLIIDDDSRNIFALSAVLRAKGFHCEAAQTAAVGLRKMRHGNYSIILMDMMMPGMDGYEAIQMIKADKDLKTLPVICVTAQAMPGDREKCMECGADGYISKPVNADELIPLMDRLINKK